jgi:hypothetical protein
MFEIHVYFHDPAVERKVDQILEILKVDPQKLADLTAKLQKPTNDLNAATTSNPVPKGE